MKSVIFGLLTLTMSLSSYAITLQFNGFADSTAKHNRLHCLNADFRIAKADALRKAAANAVLPEDCRVHDRDSSLNFNGNNLHRVCEVTLRCETEIIDD